MNVTVAFLARGVGGGLTATRDFLASYAAHPAGAPHRLVLLAKGWEQVPGRDALDAMARNAGAEILDLPDDGFDLGAYFRLAAVAETEFLYLLNTHSRVLRDNWLGLPFALAQQPGVGIVGATGSWGTYGASWRMQCALCRTALGDRRVASALCRAATVPLRWVARWVRTSRDFPGFPNPHLRFNAILIRAELLRRFAAEHRPPTTKRQSHVLESGRQGLTRFAEAAGQTVLVCGADGRGYRQQDWLDANTLYTPGQPNLLIADNHTRRYSDASVRGRRHLETLNWARTLTPPGSAA